MKKILCVLLLTALLFSLAGCGKARFSRDEDGFGYTDERTGVHYTALGTAFEAARRGDEIGTYEEKKSGVTRTFYAIYEQDAAQFLTDENGTVYCAADTPPTLDAWTSALLHIFEEDAVSVERARLTNADVVTAVLSAWKTGEETELPLDKASYVRRLKFENTACPNILYCVSFFAFGEGEGYLYLAEERRAVALDATLTGLLLAAEGVTP